MNPIDICIAGPPEYIHSNAFREVAETVHYGFHQLGIESDFNFSTMNFPTGNRRALIFGGHTISPYRKSVPTDSIIYNMEMIPEPVFDHNGIPYTPSKWAACMGGRPPYIEVLKTCSAIWDYSAHNLLNLRKYGVQCPMFHLPVSYYPGLKRIEKKENPEFDVLYIGSQNDRREKIMSELQSKRIKAQSRFGIYGAERDAYLGNSKILINSHYYDTNLLETVRVCYLLANELFVISEDGLCPHEDAEWEDGIVFSPYSKLTETCEQWLFGNCEYLGLKDPYHKRNYVAANGEALMRSKPIEKALEKVFTDMKRKGVL